MNPEAFQAYLVLTLSVIAEYAVCRAEELLPQHVKDKIVTFGVCQYSCTKKVVEIYDFCSG